MAAGNPDLKPEHGYGADLIIQKEIQNLYSFETILYVSQHKDAILWNPDGSVWKPMNVGEALYAGADVQTELKLPYSFSTSFSYSFLQTWLLTNERKFSDKKRMPYLPLHKGTGSISWKRKNTAVRLSAQYIGTRFTSTDNLTLLPSILTFDASISQVLGKGFSCYFEGKNLTSQQYMLLDGYPLPEMTITIGGRYTLE